MGKPQIRTESSRGPDGRLLPGASGNPGGRPKVAGEFRLKARAVVDELVLAAWENEVRSLGENWMRASELLAAYGYGKPSQTVDVTDAEGNVVEWTKGATLEQVLEVVRSGK